MSFFRNFFLILPILLVACTGARQTNKSPSKLEEVAFYQKNFEFLNSYSINRYLSVMLIEISDLIIKLNLRQCWQHNLAQIVDQTKPWALTTAQGQILISSGLIEKLYYEDELFFVLSHELAHIANCDLSQNPSETEQLELEMKADLFATKLLLASARPLSAAHSAINRLYPRDPTMLANTGHPSQTARLKNLHQQYPQRSWIRSSRSLQFQNFQMDVAKAASNDQ